MGDEVYGVKPPSPRQLVAERMAELVVELGLTEPYGGTVGKSETNRFWFVGFSKPANLDGQITVFSDEYITVSWTTRYLDMPHQDRMVFDNVEFAVMFMKLAFGPDRNAKEALGIPQRVPKRAKKKEAPAVEPAPESVIPESFDGDFFQPLGEGDDGQND